MRVKVIDNFLSEYQWKKIKEEMMDRNINMDDIHFAIKNSYKSSIQCIYSDFNASNLVFRIRIVESLFKTKKTSLDQSDEIYMLKNMQENILNNIILKGVKNIKKINARTIKNTMKKNNGNWVPKDIWVLDTVGTNLLDILGRDDISLPSPPCFHLKLNKFGTVNHLSVAAPPKSCPPKSLRKPL